LCVCVCVCVVVVVVFTCHNLRMTFQRSGKPTA